MRRQLAQLQRRRSLHQQESVGEPADTIVLPAANTSSCSAPPPCTAGLRTPSRRGHAPSGSARPRKMCTCSSAHFIGS
eukprot:scaffold111898_cov75-Phaeocystis_antarctica.AAC.4